MATDVRPIVPTLPPPNEHKPNSLVMPTVVAGMVTKSKEIPAGPKFLRKVKGLPSLNVELSWVFVPFHLPETYLLLIEATDHSKSKKHSLQMLNSYK
jgi:hypothetical protein